MPDDNIKNFLNAKEALIQERNEIVRRIAEIDDVLARGNGQVSAPATTTRRRGRGRKPGRKPAATAPKVKKKTKRKMSTEGLARIAEGARRRWALKKTQEKTG